jgi:hypothetical protein
MMVKEAKHGDIIELIYPSGGIMIASGRFYKVGRKTIVGTITIIKGRKRFMPEYVSLFPYNFCRKIDSKTIEGF